MTSAIADGSVEYLFRRHAGEVLGTLVRRFGDLDLAEEALQDALVEALARWPREGEPTNPAAWLVTVSRSKAIDRLRRAQMRPDREIIAFRRTPEPSDEVDDLTSMLADAHVADDQLALILLCCHPALNTEAQVALTLRSVAGLTTAEIARGFMVDLPTMSQRLVRAKHKIRHAGIPFGVPDTEHLTERIGAVMHVVYLVFNEGYASSHHDAFIRDDLCGEAIRLARTLNALIPDTPELMGLLALLLLTDARAPGRVDVDGELVTLEHQDRSLWRRTQIDEGVGLIDRAMVMRQPGRYQIEAAIAALHSSAPTAEVTDWAQIDALYGSLLQVRAHRCRRPQPRRRAGDGRWRGRRPRRARRARSAIDVDVVPLPLDARRAPPPCRPRGGGPARVSVGDRPRAERHRASLPHGQDDAAAAAGSLIRSTYSVG